MATENAISQSPLKRCQQCGKRKRRTSFYRNAGKPDGIQGMCKKCTKKNDECRVAKGRERARARRRMSKIRRSPSLTKRYREFWTRYRKSRTWGSRNPEQAERHRKCNRRHYITHKCQYHDRVHNRNARLRGNGGKHTTREWDALCQKHAFRCVACHKRKPLVRDHVVPISIGGTNDISNIQPLCAMCNAKKYVRVIDYRVH
jgi:hypothetical protein